MTTPLKDIQTSIITAFDRDLLDINSCRPANPAVPGGEPSIPSHDDGGAKIEGRSTASLGRSDEQSAHTGAKSWQATNTIGFDWPQQFHEHFPEEFPEDEKARDHVEKDGSRPAEEKRFLA